MASRIAGVTYGDGALEQGAEEDTWDSVTWDRGRLYNDVLKCRSNDQIKTNEVGGACSMRGGREKVYAGFWWGKQGRDLLEDLGVDGRILIKYIFKK